MYLHRSIEKTVTYMSERFPAVLVTGPRQVGKTTMLRTLAGGRRTYVTLDDPLVRSLAVNEPGLFLQRYEPPVIIDEIQYAPGLMEYIKIHVDEHKRMGDIWMAGSQMFHLMKHVSESLAGRVGILRMQGLSAAEMESYEEIPFSTNPQILLDKAKVRQPKSLKEVYERIFKGQMPGIYDRDIEPELFYSSYVSTYIQRDIKELTQVADEMLFLKFLTATAARTSQMLNLSDISRDIGVSIPTAKQWLSILVTSGIVVLLEPLYSNRVNRLIKTPKLYVLDTGLCSYLTRWQTPESLEAGAMSAALFETYVISEIIKGYQNQGKNPPLLYYRDKEKREIDLIIEQDGQYFPIEIKKSSAPKKDVTRHFSLLEKNGFTLGTGAVICMTKELVPLDKDNWIVPVSLV